MTLNADGYQVEVVCRANCKRMILRHRGRESCFHLSVPVGASRRAMLAFLRQNAAWMAAEAEKSLAWTPGYEQGERHWLLGRVVALGEAGVPSGAAFARFRQAQLETLIARLLPAWRARMSVCPSGVRYREMVSRWGSCQCQTGMLTLNRRLAAMPESLVEYVLVHELCHLRHPDHSGAFYRDMDAFLPDWPKRKAALNRFDDRPLPPEK